MRILYITYIRINERLFMIKIQYTTLLMSSLLLGSSYMISAEKPNENWVKDLYMNKGYYLLPTKWSRKLSVGLFKTITINKHFDHIKTPFIRAVLGTHYTFIPTYVINGVDVACKACNRKLAEIDRKVGNKYMANMNAYFESKKPFKTQAEERRAFNGARDRFIRDVKKEAEMSVDYFAAIANSKHICKSK